MKKLVTIAAVLAVGMLAGCATPYPQGILYTELKLPVDVTGNAAGRGSKVGTAECMSILGLVATGDCSVETAMKQGGISKIHHVDWDGRNILGIVGNYKVVVHGE